MNPLTRERWAELWQAAGVATEPAGWHDRLTTLYSEPHRHYHTLQHLGECLREFDQARDLGADPVAIEIALWFHDAIYDPRAHDNEERSAGLAVECLKEVSANQALVAKVERLILATKHTATASEPDAALMTDVDLAILGQPEPRFDEFERQVRAEYAWVPEALFASKRAEILEGFLKRERVYATDWFFDRLEGQARSNLRSSICQLRKQS